MNLKNYQERNVQKLVSSVIEQLDIDGMRRTIVFQAPTGAGKTVMMTEALCRLNEEIADSNCQYSQVAFIWVAPNGLHIQSYMSMKNSFTETHRLSPVVYDELDTSHDGYIKPGEVFFINWQSIYSDKNVIVRGGEQAPSIYDIIDRTTREYNIPVVCIIDEEHMFTGKNAKQSEKVLARINAKVEVRISATPKTLQPDAFIKIERSQVINEGMIKMGISLNPAIRGVLSDEALNIILLKQAMQKRQKLADAYKALGVNINPLLLIQLPNDQSATMSQDEESLKESLLANLGMMNATPDNGKVAVWLSGEKVNLDGIEKNNSVVDVLLFKQAIAMGWDCPRAAVLLIYRKLSSETFTIQTVGRIMRMPQQRFYTDADLNTGYVYTDLSADVIKIEPDDMDYIKKLHSYKREGLNNVALRSVKRERSNKENNVLRSDFKQVLQEYFAREWTLTYQPSLFSWDDEDEDDAPYSSKVQENRRIASQHVNLNVQSIKVEIPSDMNILDEEKTIRVENKTGFARTPYELKQVFERFCSTMLNGWSKSKCMSILEGAILDSLETLFEIFETEAYKVVCSRQNNPQFADIIGRALRYYRDNVMPKKLRSQASFVGYMWQVPEVRDFKDNTCIERPDVHNHAMLPYFEQIGASSPEKRFTKFLEENTDSIDWWYKNGDSGSEHFAVGYKNGQGSDALFYVDYIIRMKNGKIFLFDTKSENSDPEAPNKHNALVEYLGDDWNEGKNVMGGVIIEENQNWKYSPMKIENTSDLGGWDSFYPSNV